MAASAQARAALTPDQVLVVYNSQNADSLAVRDYYVNEGGFGDQGQLAEWIAIGGTFGIGNAYEPFTFSLAENDLYLQNFLFNNLSWAEAAWSSIPYMSWQQIVIGDPLATATVVPEPGMMSVFSLAVVGGLLRRKKTR